jgi:hypothetical protein
MSEGAKALYRVGLALFQVSSSLLAQSNTAEEYLRNLREAATSIRSELLMRVCIFYSKEKQNLMFIIFSFF